MNDIEALTYAISELRTTVTSPSGAVTLDVTADGAIHSIRLSDAGRRLSAEQVVLVIKELHGQALAQAQQVVAAAASTVLADPSENSEASGSAPSSGSVLDVAPGPRLGPSRSSVASPGIVGPTDWPDDFEEHPSNKPWKSL